jgi:outer membrane protein
MKSKLTVLIVLIALTFAIKAYSVEETNQKIIISNVNDAIKIGLQNNKDLRKKVIEIMSANANLKSSLADLILPNVNATLRFSTLDPKTLENSISKISTFKLQTNIIMGLPIPSFVIEEKTVTNAFWDNYSLAISASYRIPYLLPFGLDIGYNSYLLQSKNVELAKLQYQKALNDYIYNVKIAYYNYLFAKEFAKVAIEADKRYQENVKIAEANYASGIFSDLELIRARVQLINNQPNLYSALNNVEIQKLNLLITLGIEVSMISNVEILGSFEEIKDEFKNFSINQEELKKKILSNNPDLKILSKAIELSEASKNVSLSANKPTLSAFFNFNYDFKKTNSMENERYWVDSWNAGVQLTIPISELLPISKSYANMENADYSINKARLDYENFVNLTMSQVNQLTLKLEENRRNILAQEANVDQAKISLDIITKSYSLGSVTSIDLLDSQLAYQQAEINYLSSWLSYIGNILLTQKLSGEIINEGGIYERKN